MKIVLAPLGSRGDVQPMVALAQQLLTRGHHVTVCAAENFRALVETSGAHYVCGGEDAQSIMKREGVRVRNPIAMRRLGKAHVRTQLTSLDACAEGADVVIGSSLMTAGPTVAEHRGARFFWTAYFPLFMPSREQPSPLFSRMPRPLFGLSWSLHRLLIDGLKPTINEERAARGLAPLRTVFRSPTPEPVLCAFDGALAAVPGDWSMTHEQTGFWFLQDPAPLPAELVRFLDAGEPPVFIGFGSMPAKDPAAQTRTILAALGARRAVVAQGWAGLGADVESERVHVVAPVDHAKLFPRCAVIVHHGGAGTTAQAARAGVPQIVVPHMFDQYFWGGRAHALGVAPPPLPHPFSAPVLSAALASVDDAMRARAAALGKVLRDARGVERAADVIERSAR